MPLLVLYLVLYKFKLTLSILPCNFSKSILFCFTFSLINSPPGCFKPPSCICYTFLIGTNLSWCLIAKPYIPMAYVGLYTPRLVRLVYLSQSFTGFSLPNSKRGFLLDQTHKWLKWLTLYLRNVFPIFMFIAGLNFRIAPLLIPRSIFITSVLVLKVVCNTFNMTDEPSCYDFDFLLQLSKRLMRLSKKWSFRLLPKTTVYDIHRDY